MKSVFSVALATLLAVVSSQASAEVIGGLGAPSAEALSIKLADVYLAQVATGRIPVKAYVVQKGDTLETILRSNSSFEGANFPELINSITCDLNAAICHRPLQPASASAASGVVANPLELVPTPGDWNTLQIGETIVIPDIHIYPKIVPKEYPKAAGENLASIIARNDVCAKEAEKGLSESASNGGCVRYFEFMNVDAPEYKSLSFTGNIEVPAYDYSVQIPSNCAQLCALVSPSIQVDYSSQKYVTPPFQLVSSSLESDTIGGFQELCRASKTCADVSFGSSDSGSSAGVSTLPPEVLMRVDSGKLILNEQIWTQSLELSPMSDGDGQNPDDADDRFDGKQSAEFQSIGWPWKDSPQVATPTVMVIDSYFDAAHCNFDLGQLRVINCADDQAGSCGGADPNAPLADTNEAGQDAVPAASACGPAAGALKIEPAGDSASYLRSRHGTHTAGIIGARRRGGHGPGGINPNAKLIGLEIETDRLRDEGYTAWLSAQITTIIASNSVSVVNISLADPSPAAARDGVARNWLSELVRTFERTTLFVVAAGNKQDPDDRCLTMPACLSSTHGNVVSVVALNSAADDILDKANTNPAFTLGAYAADVLSTIPGNQFTELSGSSQAAAIVSGAASLAIAEIGSMRPTELRARLVGCSNVTSLKLLNVMVGGALDVGCLIGGHYDLISLSPDAPPKLSHISSLKPSPGDNDPTGFFFKDMENGKTFVEWDQVTGFQKLTDDTVVLFKIDKRGSVSKLRGHFVGGPTVLSGTDDGAVEDVELDKVWKYVRGEA